MFYKDLTLIKLTIIILLIWYLIPTFLNINASNEHFSSQILDEVSSVYLDQSGFTFKNISIKGNLDVLNFRGIIVQWSGDVSVIPNGWALCDGSQGRPDLRGRFILGYNPASAVMNSSDVNGKRIGAQVGKNLAGTIGTIGGEIRHKITLNEMAAHTHGYLPLITWHENGHGDFGSGNYYDKKTNTTTSTGGGSPHNILPPFYVLAYIIKL